MSLKSFEEFIKSGKVKKQTPNTHRAFAILKEVGKKKE